MNTRRNAAGRLEEEFSNAGAFPHDEQVAPLEVDANVERSLDNPPPMTKAEMRSTLSQMDQAMTTKAQEATVQAQSITSQANHDIAPHSLQQVTTMACHVRDFSQINPHIFYASRVEVNPREFTDEVYMMLYDMGVSSSEKVEFATYQLKDMGQTW